MTLASMSLILFLIMDPFGNISSFIDQLKATPKNAYKKTVLRELLFALLLMVLFAFIGEGLLQFLQLSRTTVYISSGLILFLMAFQILFPTSKSIRKNLPSTIPYVIPLALPLIAGPSLLATIMLFTVEHSFMFLMSGILISWILATFVLIFSKEIQSILKENGLVAVERLMGMILILLAIQRVAEGIILFVRGLSTQT